MDLSIAAGTPLKNFTRALTCLVKFGEDIDIKVGPSQLKLSSINASRSAFGMVIFKSHFFQRFTAGKGRRAPELRELCVTGKALLSPLKSRSTNTIEACTISITDTDPNAPLETAGECRLVVRLHCQHGVLRTHRLTYSARAGLMPNSRKAQCTSFWIASSRVLKEWTDHFHLRTGGASGSTDEITFYHGADGCRLKSFGIDPNAGPDHLSARPLGTELTVDPEDFDRYEVVDDPIITVNLKELKAIIALADSVSAPLEFAFTVGGKPILITLQGDDFVGEFTIATTAYDSTTGQNQDGGQVKREPTEVPAPAPAPASARVARPPVPSTAAATTSARASAGPSHSRPLFNPPSQQNRATVGGDEDDEYGEVGFGDLDDSAFAEIDRLSQMPLVGAGAGAGAGDASQQQPFRARETSAGPAGHRPLGGGRPRVLAADSDEEEGGGGDGDRNGLGPTQQGGGRKKPANTRWNLLG